MNPAMPPKTLLYVEPESDGHHLVYAAAIWRKLTAEGWRVSWLTTRRAVNSEAADAIIRQAEDKLEVHTCDLPRIPSSGERPLSWLRYQLRHRRRLNQEIPRLASSGPIDCIYMPWLNYCDRACGILGLPPVDIPISGLHMHMSLHEPVQAKAPLAWISRAITRRATGQLYAQRGLRTVAVLVEAFVEFARRTRIPGWQKLTYVPDIGHLDQIPPRAGSRAHFSLTEGQTAVLVFGSLTRRKGVDILLRAAGALGGEADLAVLLAGRQDAEVRAQVAAFERDPGARKVRIIAQDAFVNAEDERRLFSAADIVWVGYPGFLGSSGVLIQAGCAGLPIVSGAHGEIGRVTQRSRCGLTCDLSDAGDTLAALGTLVRDRALRARLGANGRERSRQHSPEIFGDNIYRLIQAAVEPAQAA